MELNFEQIHKCVAEWDTIICSVSSAKRNGIVTNRITWVRRDEAEKCVESFLDNLQAKSKDGRREKLTNYVLGKVDIRGVVVKEDEPNMIRLMEYLPSGQIGDVKEFFFEDGEYKLTREYNIFLGE
ncbi:MAG: hypothetical protein ACRCZ2_10545 [Fusobacteriaceae bacterium]